MSFDTVLAGLTSDDMAERQLATVRAVWGAFKDRFGVNPVLPSFYMISEDGAEVAVLDWSNTDFWATMHIHEDGRVGWYARSVALQVAASRLDPQPFDAIDEMLFRVFLPAEDSNGQGQGQAAF